MPKLRLKDLRLNQVPFYYQTYDGTVDEVDEDGNLTGESIPKYSNPVRVLARVSPNSGNAEDSPFGKDIVYDKTISTVQKLPIDEYSKLYCGQPDGLAGCCPLRRHANGNRRTLH